MAKIRVDQKTGEKRLTLAWRSKRFAEQERILSRFQRSGEALEYIMQAILVCKVAKDQGLLATKTEGSAEIPPTPPSAPARAADALKRFKL